MNDLLPSALVVALALLTLPAIFLRFTRRENLFIALGMLAHILAALAQVWLHRSFYGYGDILSYFRDGSYLAGLMRENFVFYAPEVLRILFQQEPLSSVWVMGLGSSTGTMSALAGFLAFATDSLVASGLVLSMTAFYGQLAMYSAFRHLGGSRFVTRMAISVLLVPSVVFWSSGIVKESVALSGLGLACLGLSRAIHRRPSPGAIALVALGLGLMALTKAYLLMPFTVAGGAWFYWQRSLTTRGSVALVTRPLYLFVGLGIAMGGLVAVGRLFPRYSVERLADEVRLMQELGTFHEGRANYQLTSSNARESASLTDQLQATPMAVVTVLFRPFLFEAHNGPSLVNALETTAVLLLAVYALWRRGLRASFQFLTASPVLMFCLVFVLLTALGVGMTTTNLGTLSRYRVPMMPLYFMLLMALVPLRPERARAKLPMVRPLAGASLAGSLAREAPRPAGG